MMGIVANFPTLRVLNRIRQEFLESLQGMKRRNAPFHETTPSATRR